MNLNNTKQYLSINSDWVFELKNKKILTSNYFGKSRIITNKENPILFTVLKEIIKVGGRKKFDFGKFVLLVQRLTNLTSQQIRDALYELVHEDILILSHQNHILSKGEIKRYLRQLMFWNKYQKEKKDIYDIQNKFKKTELAVIGLGGEGAVVAVHLGSVGIGNLHLIDGDLVEESNLSRQVFYNHRDVGLKKAHVLKKYIKKQNKYICVTSVDRYILKSTDLKKYLRDVNFIILCGDHPMVKLREWVNSYAVSNNIPHIGVSGGWVGPICVPHITACFECEKYFFSRKYKIYKRLIEWVRTRKPQQYRPAFVFRPTLSGLMIAQQVVKYISGCMDVEVLEGRWSMNLELNTFFEKIPRNTKCKICGKTKSF